MKKNRNGAIDFWRFVFAAALVVFHTHVLDIHQIYKPSSFPLPKGALAVEFFLLTSGFLLANSLNKPGRDEFSWSGIWRFIKGKLMSFYPAFVICWALAFIATSIVNYTDLSELAVSFFRSVFELTLIRNAGYNVARVLPQSWYLSAMIISMFLLYPLYAKNKRRFEHWLAPMIALFLLGYLCVTSGSLLNPSEELFFTYKGNLRAFAEICLGVVSYDIFRMIKKVDLTRFGSVLLAITELFGYVFTLLYMQNYKMFPEYFQFVVLFMLMISVAVTFSEKSIISPLFNRRIFVWMGRFSLYPFLLYSVFAETLPVIFPEMRMRYLIILYFVLTYACSAAVMTAQDCVSRRLRERKKRITGGEVTAGE